MEDVNHLAEMAGKAAHDHPFHNNNNHGGGGVEWVPYPLIIGAGPSGLAAAACLQQKGIPSLILERDSCLASLWQLRAYDRLKLHLPKQFCELPFMPFPPSFPTYPSRLDFIDYLHSYASRFGLRPVFNTRVVSAEFDQSANFWRVTTEASKVYASRWLVVATGENADMAVPDIEGMMPGEGVHTSEYKSGVCYSGKRVCVVGCGNSGIEVCLDLCNHSARPELVVRGTVHILPREMLGRSTFGLTMFLLKWFPVRVVDRILLTAARLILGDTSRYGLVRPELGPMELKAVSGKTPVLDVGTLDKIKSGDVKVRPGIRRVRRESNCELVEFEDGTREEFDAIILATGYKSNVPSWLKENKMFSKKNGLPKRPFSNGWKGECGLYAVGFTQRGLLGTSMDANNVADDIANHFYATYKSKKSI